MYSFKLSVAIYCLRNCCNIGSLWTSLACKHLSACTPMAFCLCILLPQHHGGAGWKVLASDIQSEPSHGPTLPQSPFSLRPLCPHGTQFVCLFAGCKFDQSRTKARKTICWQWRHPHILWYWIVHTSSQGRVSAGHPKHAKLFMYSCRWHKRHFIRHVVTWVPAIC
jgi:hypothetical protein